MIDWITGYLGENVPPAVGVIILFCAIIIAIFLILWIARKILGGTFVAGGRARHLRLAIMDATPVDSRRRLVLVRRDDVEHLILIGGPTDVVVEQNIKTMPAATTKQSIAPDYLQENKPASAKFHEQTPPSPKISAQESLLPKPPIQATPPVPPVPHYPERPSRPAAATNSVPARPLPPSTPSAFQPTPSNTTTAHPPMTAAPFPKPATPYVRPTSGPAAVVTTAAAIVAPAIKPLSDTIASSHTAPKSGTAVPPEGNVLTVTAAQNAPVAADDKPAQVEAVTQSIPDPNDSLLMDLSDEISRVSATEPVEPEFSLEEEMESLLADLDVKAERAT